MGRHEDAAAATRSAKTFNKWSIIINIIVIAFIFLLQLGWIIPTVVRIALADNDEDKDEFDYD